MILRVVIDTALQFDKILDTQKTKARDLQDFKSWSVGSKAEKVKRSGQGLSCPFHASQKYTERRSLRVTDSH